MVKATNGLTQRGDSCSDIRLDQSHSKSISQSRSKSIPKPETLEQQPESLNITLVNKNLKLTGILKKSESVKRIGSARGSRGAGSIASNKNSSVKTDRGCNRQSLTKTLNIEETKLHQSTGLLRQSSELKTSRNQHMNASYAESIQSYDSRFGTQRKVPGSIFRGNSAKKELDSSFNGSRLLNRENDSVRKSLDHQNVFAQESPVYIQKELRFETEQSKETKEETNDLNTLLQFNDNSDAEPKQQNTIFERLEESNILDRHAVVKRDILALPRPAPSATKNMVENLRSFDEPIIINSIKVFEPFYSYIWSCLKTQPLTTIKLKLSKKSELNSMCGKVAGLLSQSISEQSTTPSAKLSALQYRLIRILYK